LLASSFSLIIIDYIRNVTADGEGLLVGTWSFKADSDWRSLPGGRGTGGVRAGVVGQDSQKKLLQDRLLAVQLGYEELYKVLCNRPSEEENRHRWQSTTH
jgi:hypothetical protein